MTKKLWTYILFVVLIVSANKTFATHNRSGEITYTWISGNTYKLRITTYTKASSTAADRCSQTIYISNSVSVLDSLDAPRVNGPFGTCSSTANGAKDGVILISASASNGGIKENIYEAVYTFPGATTYIVYMSDPNRNEGINNITSSVDVAFSLSTTITIYNGGNLVLNNSPTLLNPPIDEACLNRLFIHNPGASDPDGDSLSYSLTSCLGDDAIPLSPGQYFIPPNVSIDPVYGDLIWNVPTQLGEFNFAILITEWRKDANGVYKKVGTTLRDLQVTVNGCNNNPPSITPINDTCVVAGTNLNFTVTANDVDGDLITLTATGMPFTITPAATFPGTVNAAPIASSPFSWTPNCSQVKNTPYLITIKAKDNNSNIPLVDFESFFIRVVAPAPQNLTANQSGASIILNWNPPPICLQTTGNILLKYLIYRADSCKPFIPSPCETGLPSNLGYSLIGSTFGVNSTTFTDNNNGIGLSQGTTYSYIVVAQFADGSLSLASTNVCKDLKTDIPILLNASVDTTDALVGQNFVRWMKPMISAGNLDTIANPGPYEFRLMHHSGFASAPFTQIANVIKSDFYLLNQLSDTTFSHTNINTETTANTYRVDFYANSVFMGSTQVGSTIFLTATPNARRVALSWQVQTPWTNQLYYIYRQNFSNTGYTLIDSTSLLNYTDSNLVNGATYCYKIRSKGQYNNLSIYHPLYNWSQKACATPVDKEPPCKLTVTIGGDCEDNSGTIKWNNPNHSCTDDVVKYYIYYSPNNDSTPIRIDSILTSNDTTYTLNSIATIAGCWSVTAVDSAGNESALSDLNCVDYCPEYELPNIVTFNADQINDIYHPVKNRHIKDVNFRIYDRWGILIFETNDPAIMWDGKSKQLKKPVTDGTYYYTCDVNEMHYYGTVTRKLKGFIQVFIN